MIRGSCLCKSVKFEINDKILVMANCHCSECRKFTGSAFGTLAFCKKNDFKFITGDEFIANYILSEKFTRTFCKKCGSPLPVKNHDKFNGLIGIPAGLLDDNPNIKPTKHLFTIDKAPWWDITDNIQQFDEWPNL